MKTTRANKLLFFVLCAAIVFTALAYGAVHQPTIAFFYLLAVLVVCLWAFDAVSSGVLRFSRNAIQLPLVAAFLYGVFQIIPFGVAANAAGVSGIPRTISLEPFETQLAAAHFFALFIFLAASLTYIDTTKRLRAVASFITIFGFVFAFFAILQAVLSPNKIYGIYEVPYATPFGSFVNRHNFAAYMELTVAVPLGLMFAGAVPRDKRLLYVTAIALMGVALLLSGSRGGLVSLLAEIFLLLILTTRTKSPAQLGLKISLTVLLAATVVFGAILIGGESSLTRIAETAASQDFTTNRTHIWSVTLAVIKNNLPFGAGFGAFGVAYTPFDTLSGLERVEQAHNDYLQILADAGFVGLIIAAFFVFKLFKDGLQNAKTSDKFRRGIAIGALSGCFAVLVHSLFDFVLHTTAIALLFITLVSLITASRNKDADEPEENFASNRKRKTAANGSVASFEKRKRAA